MDSRSPVKSSTIAYLRSKTKKPGIPKSARDSLTTGLVASLASKSGKVEIRAEDEIVGGAREIVQRAYLRVPGESYSAGWVLDDEVNACMHCTAKFSLFRGKHHCRNCGDIICNDCSKHRIILSNIKSSKGQRVCNVCAVKLKTHMSNVAKNVVGAKQRQTSRDINVDESMHWRNTIGANDVDDDHMIYEGQRGISYKNINGSADQDMLVSLTLDSPEKDPRLEDSDIDGDLPSYVPPPPPVEVQEPQIHTQDMKSQINLSSLDGNFVRVSDMSFVSTAADESVLNTAIIDDIVDPSHNVARKLDTFEDIEDFKEINARQETEIENLRAALKQALDENSLLKQKNAMLEKELSSSNDQFALFRTEVESLDIDLRGRPDTSASPTSSDKKKPSTKGRILSDELRVTLVTQESERKKIEVYMQPVNVPSSYDGDDNEEGQSSLAGLKNNATVATLASKTALTNHMGVMNELSRKQSLDGSTMIESGV